MIWDAWRRRFAGAHGPGQLRRFAADCGLRRGSGSRSTKVPEKAFAEKPSTSGISSRCAMPRTIRVSKDNAMVTGEPHVRFYAGTPLVDEEGFVLGTLCVLDTRPRQLTAEQRDGLRALGRQVISELALRRHLMRSQQRQEYYRALAEDGMGLICTHLLDGTLCWVNTAALNLLGYTAQEVEGRRLRDFVASSNWESVDAYLNELWVEGVAAGQLHVLTKSGERLVLGVSQPRHQGAGRHGLCARPCARCDRAAYRAARLAGERRTLSRTFRRCDRPGAECGSGREDPVRERRVVRGARVFAGLRAGMNLREVIVAEGWPGYAPRCRR